MATLKGSYSLHETTYEMLCFHLRLVVIDKPFGLRSNNSWIQPFHIT
jgi:hypothetical protein